MSQEPLTLDGKKKKSSRKRRKGKLGDNNFVIGVTKKKTETPAKKKSADFMTRALEIAGKTAAGGAGFVLSKKIRDSLRSDDPNASDWTPWLTFAIGLGGQFIGNQYAAAAAMGMTIEGFAALLRKIDPDLAGFLDKFMPEKAKAKPASPTVVKVYNPPALPSDYQPETRQMGDTNVYTTDLKEPIRNNVEVISGLLKELPESEEFAQIGILENRKKGWNLLAITQGA